MNINEFKEGIELIQLNYNKTFSKEQLKLYYEELKDMDKERYMNNIKYHIATSPFIPNIAQIKNCKRILYSNFESRDYSNMDFEQFYANKN